MTVSQLFLHTAYGCLSSNCQTRAIFVMCLSSGLSHPQIRFWNLGRTWRTSWRRMRVLCVFHLTLFAIWLYDAISSEKHHFACVSIELRPTRAPAHAQEKKKCRLKLKVSCLNSQHSMWIIFSFKAKILRIFRRLGGEKNVYETFWFFFS